MSGTVRQIQVVSDPRTPYFLQVDWIKDLGAGFTLALSDGSLAWIGEVSEEEVTKEAKATGVLREKYVEDLCQALIGGEDGVGQEVEYSFHLPQNHSRLSYMKTYKGNLVTVGSAELQPAPEPFELNRELISQALERGTDLESQNHELLDENQRLKQEQRRLLTELERHVQYKDSMEREMYSRFVMVLNEKKARIRRLQDTVKHLRQMKDQISREEGYEDFRENFHTAASQLCVGVGDVPSATAEGGDTSQREEPPQTIDLFQAPTILIPVLEAHPGGTDDCKREPEKE
ncbi:DNA repair protein XRCC4-like [Aplochiton taeniatus]